MQLLVALLALLMGKDGALLSGKSLSDSNDGDLSGLLSVLGAQSGADFSNMLNGLLLGGGSGGTETSETEYGEAAGYADSAWKNDEVAAFGSDTADSDFGKITGLIESGGNMDNFEGGGENIDAQIDELLTKIGGRQAVEIMKMIRTLAGISDLLKMFGGTNGGSAGTKKDNESASHSGESRDNNSDIFADGAGENSGDNEGSSYGFSEISGIADGEILRAMCGAA